MDHGRVTDSGLQERRIADTVDLAFIRTELANRRTLLAYGKTAIALFAAGCALLHLYREAPLAYVLGGLLLLSAVGAMVVGSLYYWRTKREIDAERLECGLPPRGTWGEPSV